MSADDPQIQDIELDRVLVQAEVKQKNRRYRILLIIILLLAAVLRVWGLSDRRLGLDELWAIANSTGRGSPQFDLPINQVIPMPRMTQMAGSKPAYTIWTSIKMTTHPPGFFLVLRAWREMFGESDLAVRCLSILFSLAAIAMLYSLGRRLFDDPVPALWACVLMAVAQPQIEYAQVVRPYAMLMFLGILSLWLIARIESDHVGAKARWYVGLGLTIFCMLLVHYFAVGAAGALLIYAMVRFRRRVRWRIVAAIAGGGILWLIVWGPMLREHFRAFHGHDPTMECFFRPAPPSETSPVQFAEWLGDLGAAPLRLLVKLPIGKVEWGWLAGIGLILLLLIAARARRGFILLPAVWMLGTLGFVGILDLARSTITLQIVRYLLLASPCLYLILVSAIRWKLAQHLVSLALLILCVARIEETYVHIDPDWPALCAVLNSPAHANELLVFPRHGHPQWWVGFLMMAYSHYSEPASTRRVLEFDPDLPSDPQSLSKGQPQMWMLCYPSPPPPPVALPPGYEASLVAFPTFEPPLLWSLTPRRN